MALKFRIITQPNCKWCDKAKELLKSRHMKYEEQVLGKDVMIKEFAEEGFSTVPQIFQGERHIGGYEDLAKYVEENLAGFGKGAL